MTVEFKAWTDWAGKCAAVKSLALASYYVANRSDTSCAEDKSAAATAAADLAVKMHPECAALWEIWERTLVKP